MCYYSNYTCKHIFMVENFKLLDNVKIHNVKLFKCYLEDSNILTLISLLTVQHSVWLENLYQQSSKE